jgi:hypothetical protein
MSKPLSRAAAVQLRDSLVQFHRRTSEPLALELIKMLDTALQAEAVAPATPSEAQPDSDIVIPAEQLKRHGLSQPPLLDTHLRCGKCHGWPLIVMPHDNTLPDAIRAACPKCGSQFTLRPGKSPDPLTVP